jgi:hypothetical protein
MDREGTSLDRAPEEYETKVEACWVQDLVAEVGLEVGEQEGVEEGGEAAAWGGVLCLRPSTMLRAEATNLTFWRIKYTEANVGFIDADPGDASGWTNRILWDGVVVHESGGHSAMKAGEGREFWAEVMLGTPDAMNHTLEVQLDVTDAVVGEEGEGRANVFSTTARFCGFGPKVVAGPDIVVNQKAVRVGQTVCLTDADLSTDGAGGLKQLVVAYTEINQGPQEAVATFAAEAGWTNNVSFGDFFSGACTQRSLIVH